MRKAPRRAALPLDERASATAILHHLIEAGDLAELPDGRVALVLPIDGWLYPLIEAFDADGDTDLEPNTGDDEPCGDEGEPSLGSLDRDPDQRRWSASLAAVHDAGPMAALLADGEPDADDEPADDDENRRAFAARLEREAARSRRMPENRESFNLTRDPHGRPGRWERVE